MHVQAPRETKAYQQRWADHNPSLLSHVLQSVCLKVDILAIIEATHTWHTFGKIILVDIYIKHTTF